MRSEPGGPDEPGRGFGIILRSTDGGAHWTPTLTRENGSFAGISFADATRGWVVGSGEILRSDDSGLTWSSERAAVPVELFSLEAVQALSRDTVVAVGGGVPLQGTGNAPSLILRTEDAGATWTVAPITTDGGGDPTRTRLASVCINTAGIGLAVGSGTTTRLVARTSDNGQSWTDVTSVVLQGSAAFELFDVACLDDEFWIVANGGALVVYSADAGGSWTDRHVPAAVAALLGISAPAHGVAVAVGLDSANKPVIIRTSDAGSNWTRAPIDGLVAEGALNDVSFAGPDDGTTIGEPLGSSTASVTAISETQGMTWTAGQSLADGVRLKDIARVN